MLIVIFVLVSLHSYTMYVSVFNELDFSY